MRIRLDKLFLSAGLALAVIATTIPVRATVTTETVTTNGESVTTVTAVEGLVKDNTAVNLSTPAELKAFYSALVGSSVADNVSLTATVPDRSADSAAVPSDVLNTKADEPKVEISDAKKVNDIGITAIKTIDLSTELATFKSAITTIKSSEATLKGKQDAVAEAASTFANVLASKTEEPTTSAKTYNYGTYTVGEKTPTSDTTVKSKAAVVAGINLETDTEGEALTAAINDCLNAADSTYTQVTTYTVTSLPTGYSFDVILGTESEATNLKHTVYSQDRTAAKTNEEITDITELTDGTVAISVTDFTLDYFLVTTQVSTSTDLITGSTDPNGLATVTIKGVANPSGGNTAKEKIDASVEENGYKLVSYLEIRVSDGGPDLTSTDKEITFTIDVPVDMPEGVTYKVLRLHDGTVDVLDTTVADGKITFTSRLFSDFALVYTAAAEDPTGGEEQPDSNTPDSNTPDSPTTPGGSGDGTPSKTGTNTADNSMMPLFMTTLLLALCAGSLAIYKEKKTN